MNIDYCFHSIDYWNAPHIQLSVYINGKDHYFTRDIDKWPEFVKPHLGETEWKWKGRSISKELNDQLEQMLKDNLKKEEAEIYPNL